ncbi:hypothetical protein BJX63DRAFT_433155 [Aspergillus granulosus]|uniref:Uncharacterized protein n=1 Tax=Aspergillus granulosus TaxID=176169 RepID=A0ABR4H8M2_9EURO
MVEIWILGRCGEAQTSKLGAPESGAYQTDRLRTAFGLSDSVWSLDGFQRNCRDDQALLSTPTAIKTARVLPSSNYTTFSTGAPKRQSKLQHRTSDLQSDPTVPALTSGDCCFRIIDHMDAGRERRLDPTKGRSSTIHLRTASLTCTRLCFVDREMTSRERFHTRMNASGGDLACREIVPVSNGASSITVFADAHTAGFGGQCSKVQLVDRIFLDGLFRSLESQPVSLK